MARVPGKRVVVEIDRRTTCHLESSIQVGLKKRVCRSDVRDGLLKALIQDALQVIALQDSLGVKHAVGEVAKIDAGVRVLAVAVAAEAERGWVCCEFDEEVAKYTG